MDGGLGAYSATFVGAPPRVMNRNRNSMGAVAANRDLPAFRPHPPTSTNPFAGSAPGHKTAAQRSQSNGNPHVPFGGAQYLAANLPELQRPSTVGSTISPRISGRSPRVFPGGMLSGGLRPPHLRANIADVRKSDSAMVIKGSSATQPAPNSSRGPAPAHSTQNHHVSSLPPTRSPLPVNGPSHLVPNPPMYFQQITPPATAPTSTANQTSGLGPTIKPHPPLAASNPTSRSGNGRIPMGMAGKSILSPGSRHNFGFARASTTGNIVPMAPTAPRAIPGPPTAPVAAAPKRRHSWVKGVAKSVPPPQNRRHVIPASGLNITSSVSMANSNNSSVPAGLGSLSNNQKPVSLAQHASRKVVASQKIASSLGDEDIVGSLGGGAQALASALSQPYEESTVPSAIDLETDSTLLKSKAILAEADTGSAPHLTMNVVTSEPTLEPSSRDAEPINQKRELLGTDHSGGAEAEEDFEGDFDVECEEEVMPSPIQEEKEPDQREEDDDDDDDDEGEEDLILKPSTSSTGPNDDKRNATAEAGAGPINDTLPTFGLPDDDSFNAKQSMSLGDLHASDSYHGKHRASHGHLDEDDVHTSQFIEIPDFRYKPIPGISPKLAPHQPRKVPTIIREDMTLYPTKLYPKSLADKEYDEKVAMLIELTQSLMKRCVSSEEALARVTAERDQLLRNARGVSED